MQITVTDLFDGVTPETSPVTITVVEGSATSGGGGAVDSVNGDTGVVVLDATDVGADPAGTATAAVAAHAAAGDPHSAYLTTAEGNAAYDAAGAAATAQTAAEATAASALTTHASDTTSVHGITDTSDLVLDDDARLTNSRTPTAHATSHQDGGTDELALDGSQITSGTVADARIASTIARDSEVTTAVSDHAAAADPHTGYVKESDYDANTILAATTDNTPAALTVAASRIVGRKATGDIAAMTAADAAAVLGSGTRDATTFLRGDNTWAVPAGGSAPPSPDVLTDFDAVYGSPLASATDYEFNAATSSLPSGWSWVNQGTSTYVERLGAGILTPQTGSESLRMIVRAIPAESTWTAYAKIGMTSGAANWHRSSLIIRDSSTGALIQFGLTQRSGFHLNKWSNPTTFSSAIVEDAGAAMTNPVIFRIHKNSGTSFDFYVSNDGVAWQTVTTAYNPSMTVDTIGFMAGAPSSGSGHDIHWYRVRA